MADLQPTDTANRGRPTVDDDSEAKNLAFGNGTGLSEDGASLPERYRIRETESGVFLGCEEAPRVRVNLNAANSFSEAEARELGERTILLDGAGTFGPLLDNKMRLYNLDHHEGCERAFTLATCEQALLLVHSGLELADGDWTIYANEPDLDTTLAIWCLFNHQRLAELRPDARDVLLPLIRLEGAIDSNGSDLAQICGLPERVMADAQQRLNALIKPELDLKKENQWTNTDLNQFTLEQLNAIDVMIFQASDFHQYTSIEEVYGHTEITPRRVAVACRDHAGIYEVEQSLKTQWGDQLLLIALEKEPGQYTLRRTTALSDLDLGQAYEWLNRLDPLVDGCPPSKRWGGSANIGGSPRPSGTGLSPSEILETLQFAFKQPSPWRAVRKTCWLSVFSIGLMVVGSFAGLCWNLWPGAVERSMLEPARVATFGGLAALICASMTIVVSRHRTWLYGWRRSAGSDWLWLLPLPLLAGIPARSWVPQEPVLDAQYLLAALGAIVLGALGTEFWFRGLVHGSLLLDSAVQRVSGPWHVSLAATVSSFQYAAVCAGASLWWVMAEPAPILETAPELLLVFMASLLGGFGLAMIRERSLSLWPGVLIQITAGILSAAFWLWLPRAAS
jgi:hypothetical protein